ncbi:Prefoldin, molecular chaperone implicated in de novo protein folding, alpha subunit [Pyrobaculum oguniense TE7]|uniref:Prefoldin, molecular chaperone implicated in de novo protein folding, alpha subunit n=1 Tax=Pyrobaculum oguniense (strain DSM 13380 / JCM 10595 / TE7) TaxID=698757 RepID=H6QDK8_PYROT|nr:Prefoldin, molecular chaperone implicated in de novo protein folding, alpha subunit [Pyrobaculum oguniense TE7]
MSQRALQLIAYIYGKEVAERLSGHEIRVEYNKTGRIRYVYVDNKLAFVLRNNDGHLLPTLYGAEFINRKVVVSNEAAEFVKLGRNVPAKYIVEVRQARPNSEVAIVDTRGTVIAVGRLVYSQGEITLRRGYAVKVRESLESTGEMREPPQ